MTSDPFTEFPNPSPAARPSPASSSEVRLNVSSGWGGWNIRQRILIGIVIAFLVIAAVASALFILGRNSFDPNRVQIAIETPKEIVSGAEVEFAITIHNGNNVHLEDAEFVFTFPEGALQLDDQGREREADPIRLVVNRIRSGEDVRYFFVARLLGNPEAAQFAEGVLQYRPSSINARFESRHSSVIHIGRSPIDIAVEVPRKALGGEVAVYRITYRVEEDLSFETARIVAEFPDDFHVEDSSPEPVDGTDNQWEFSNLSAGDEGEIIVNGILYGVAGQIKRLRVAAGEWRGITFTPFTRIEKETIIDSHPLTVDIDVKGASAGSADIDSSLVYTILFRNDADVALRELILRARFIGSIFDLRDMRSKGASFKDGGELLEWTASSVPQLALLAPGEEGKVEILVSLKSSFPIESFRDKNFNALLEVDLETLSVPDSFSLERLVRHATSEIKINSDVTLQQLGFYNETSSSITNSGPHPPKIGERTTYTIHWRLLNAGNDIINTVVRSSLPPGIDWMGRVATAFSETQLRFNDRTREIVWDIGNVPATTGVVLPTYEVVFQIALTPSLQQEGDTPTLIESVVLEAVDQFTGALRFSGDGTINTLLPDDLSVGRSGRVGL